VERFAGYEIPRQCSRALLINPPRASQTSFCAPLVQRQYHDEKIRQAEQHMNEYYSAHFTIDELAQRMSMSARNFTRRFKQAVGDSPLTHLHKLRIARARQLLETDFKSVQQICY